MSDLRIGLEDRAQGALIGAAVGDALGAGYEFGLAPFTGTPEMIGGGLGNFEPGEWTDDTIQTFMVAKAAAQFADLSGEEALNSIAKELADWYLSGPADIGIQTSAVLRECGPNPTAAELTAAAKAHMARTGRAAGKL